MPNAKDYFYKQGGFKLIKQYFRSGVLCSAISQFLILGRSKTALEILRLSVSLKIKQKLYNKYKVYLGEFEKQSKKELPHEDGHVVWVFWWQGMEDAPHLVKICYASIKKNLIDDWKIILITKDNYTDFVTFPTHIIKKFTSGVITLTHLSDLLRLELLINHGGLWVDATVYCTSKELPKSILDSELFVYQMQKPGADGNATIMSSWVMRARTNNIILLATRALLYKYWENHNYLIDYFLLHQFFTIACEHFPEESKKIPPLDNSTPHLLLLHLLEPYDNNRWLEWKSMSCFHKLSYKIDINNTSLKGTFYDKIINGDDTE